MDTKELKCLRSFAQKVQKYHVNSDRKSLPARDNVLSFLGKILSLEVKFDNNFDERNCNISVFVYINMQYSHGYIITWIYTIFSCSVIK